VKAAHPQWSVSSRHNTPAGGTNEVVVASQLIALKIGIQNRLPNAI
jgi:hypothetical protein